MKRFFFAMSLFLLILPAPARAQTPMAAVQGSIDRIISVLKEPRYRNPDARELQRAKISEIVREVFDFREMARRTLARSWRKFTPRQQEEFTDIFHRFLEQTYLDKIQKDYHDQKVVYLEEKKLSSSKAVVKTKVIREDVETPINYRLLKKKGAWRVYDVTIEGVSLVKNYRSQFRKILVRKSPEQLIERLKRRIAEKKKKKEKEEGAS